MEQNISIGSLPQTLIMNSLSNSPKLNTQQNIISGPNSGDYWNHSPGLQKPILREEGPFPMQGNIGSLINNETNNFSSCSMMGPHISGSPNCTVNSTFRPDIYTTHNTCGDNCVLKNPEAYGGKDFGMVGDKITNSHALHAYQNIRASTEGTGSSINYGCYEWIPKLDNTKGNSCILNQYNEFQTVGDWQNLPQSSNIINYTYKQ